MQQPLRPTIVRPPSVQTSRLGVETGKNSLVRFPSHRAVTSVATAAVKAVARRTRAAAGQAGGIGDSDGGGGEGEFELVVEPLCRTLRSNDRLQFETVELCSVNFSHRKVKGLSQECF